MGYTLKTSITKICGCVINTYEHDDFNTTYDDTDYCHECATKLNESRVDKDKYFKMGETKYNEFIDGLYIIDVDMVPIKILREYKYKSNKYGQYYIIGYDLFNKTKHNNKWYVNKNAVELFFKIGLDEYYRFPKI